jgi:hypothetical protein
MTPSTDQRPNESKYVYNPELERKLMEVIAVLIYKGEIKDYESLKGYCSLFSQGEKLLQYMVEDLINAAILAKARDGLAAQPR